MSQEARVHGRLEAPAAVDRRREADDPSGGEAGGPHGQRRTVSSSSFTVLSARRRLSASDHRPSGAASRTRSGCRSPPSASARSRRSPTRAAGRAWGSSRCRRPRYAVRDLVRDTPLLSADDAGRPTLRHVASGVVDVEFLRIYLPFGGR